MLHSYPEVIVALLNSRHYSLGLAVAYCTLSVSKLIMVISPVTFQNISSTKGFWFSLLAALVVPLLTEVLNQIKCGDYAKEVDNPFHHTKMIKAELGMPNFVFGGAVANDTTTEEEAGELKAEANSCVHFPTLIVFIIVIITFEIIKVIQIMIIIEIRKTNIKT